MSKSYSISTEKTLVDINTGEIVKAETVKTIVKKIDCEHFYMLYNGFADKARGLTGVSKDIFDYLCKNAVWDTGEVFITTGIRQNLQKILNVSNSTISKSLNTLYSKELLIKKDSKVFISPEIFWKGDQTTRRKLLLENAELEITYSIKNKNIKEQE